MWYLIFLSLLSALPLHKVFPIGLCPSIFTTLIVFLGAYCICMKTKSLVIKRTVKGIMLYLIGASLYVIIELLFRGFSHYSMYFLGGLCFLLIGLINEITDISITSQMIISAVIITTLELISGYIVNIYLGLNVWDYSNMPYNFNGQICLLFFNAWILLSLVGIVVDDIIRHILFKENMVKYRL